MFPVEGTNRPLRCRLQSSGIAVAGIPGYRTDQERRLAVPPRSDYQTVQSTSPPIPRFRAS